MELLGGDLSGRVALVTGASRLNGIGAAVRRGLAACGADVAFTHWTAYDQDRYHTDASEPEVLRQELLAYGGRVQAIEIDLAAADAAIRLLDEVNEGLGTVDIVINNAAYCVQDGFDQLTSAELDRHYAVNLRTTMLLSSEFARRFPEAKTGGRVVNMTSGQEVGAMPDQLAYAATKGAIATFSSSLAAGVARKRITVNAVDPGGTDTGWMTDELKATIGASMAFGRIGQPEDAARIILFLVSDAGQWITGQVVHSRGA
jgi:3-oxoacyl-[acyl-carrier protein] reductase